MNSAIEDRLSGSQRKTLLLDSNLLILWVTAQYDLRLLTTFKRVSMFTQDDAVLLEWIIDQFRSTVTTTHVVTEASNLGNSLPERSRPGWFALLAEFASNTLEETHALSELATHDEFIRFGLTDSALHNLADTHQVLTIDRRLSNYTNRSGLRVLNFQDLQQMV